LTFLQGTPAISADYEQKKPYDKALQQYQQSLNLQGDAELAKTIGRIYGARGWKGILEKEVEILQQPEKELRSVDRCRRVWTIGGRRYGVLLARKGL